jgi:hypothetical protein
VFFRQADNDLEDLQAAADILKNLSRGEFTEHAGEIQPFLDGIYAEQQTTKVAQLSGEAD